jgi:uncharacterized OB-fold protein
MAEAAGQAEEQTVPTVASVDSQRFRVEPDGRATLIGGRCGHCGCLTWSVRAMCPKCWATDDQQEIALPAKGALYSMTAVQRAQNGYRGPYAVGVVDLPGGVRVFGRIHWPEGSRWQAGAEMELFAERLDFDGGQPSMWVPAFKPSEVQGHA